MEKAIVANSIAIRAMNSGNGRRGAVAEAGWVMSVCLRVMRVRNQTPVQPLIAWLICVGLPQAGLDAMI
jgi:hypothetical protein